MICAYLNIHPIFTAIRGIFPEVSAAQLRRSAQRARNIAVINQSHPTVAVRTPRIGAVQDRRQAKIRAFPAFLFIIQAQVIVFIQEIESECFYALIPRGTSPYGFNTFPNKSYICFHRFELFGFRITNIQRIFDSANILRKKSYVFLSEKYNKKTNPRTIPTPTRTRTPRDIYFASIELITFDILTTRRDVYSFHQGKKLRDVRAYA